MIEKEFNGHKFRFVETKTAPGLIDEIFSDNYKVFKSKIEFNPGDVIVDIGANEGIFSVMMGTFFPGTRVLAVEPVPKTVNTLRENIRLNECKNVEVVPYCVARQGRDKVRLTVSKDFSGGSTGKCTFNPEHHYSVEVPAFTLNELFRLIGVERCRLMKMDIEGMEYEALYDSSVLERVDYFTGEFHMNRKLEYEGRRMDALINWVSNKTKVIHIELCSMAE
jgi:FkbM family methyltransferase